MVNHVFFKLNGTLLNDFLLLPENPLLVDIEVWFVRFFLFFKTGRPIFSASDTVIREYVNLLICFFELWLKPRKKVSKTIKVNNLINFENSLTLILWLTTLYNILFFFNLQFTFKLKNKNWTNRMPIKKRRIYLLRQ